MFEISIKFRIITCLLIWISALVLSTSDTYGQRSANPEADKSDSIRANDQEGVSNIIREDEHMKKMNAYIQSEHRNILIRKNVLQKYKDKVFDKKFYDELYQTITSPPFYWKDIESGASEYLNNPYSAIPVDTISLSSWELAYADIRYKYLSYPGTTERKKRQFLEFEIKTYLNRRTNPDYRSFSPIKSMLLKKLFSEFVASTSHFSDSSGSDWYLPYAEINQLLMFKSRYGFSFDDFNSFILLFKNSKSLPLKKWFRQKSNLLSLRNDGGLKIKAADLRGEIVDLNEYKGKVVLIDFWATWCSTCLEKMPEIYRLYKKYKLNGFEVLSFSINTPAEVEKVESALKRSNVEFSTCIIGPAGLQPKGSKQKEGMPLGIKLWDKYGFFAVPQLLLLDRSGRLVEYGDRLFGSDIESIIADLVYKKS